MGTKQVSLPQSWSQQPILEVVALPSGQVDPREPPYRDWPLLAPNHIESGTGRWTLVETAIEQRAKSGKYVFEPGDVVYSKIRPYLRKATLVRRRGLCSADMYPLRAGAHVTPGYLLAVLLSDEFTEFASSVSMRTGIPKINRKELAQYQITLPPLGEQRKIAAILSSVDDVIDKTEAVIEQLEVVKKAMMQELLTRGLPGRHTRFKKTEIGEIPASWDVAPLNDLIEPTRPICYGILKPGKGYAGGVPVIKVKNIKFGRIDDSNLLLTSPDIDQQYRRSKLKPGDILLSIRGTSGRLAIVPPSLEGANITQDTARLSIRRDINAKYIYHCLHSPMLQKQIADNTRGQAVKGINIGDVRKLSVPLPPPDEQKKIAQFFDAIGAYAAKTFASFQALGKTKSALMSILLTGEVRVTPEEDTP